MHDLKFWKNQPNRPNNPSYKSKLVQESLFIESFEKERFKPKYSTIHQQYVDSLKLKTQKKSGIQVLAQSTPIFASIQPGQNIRQNSQKSNLSTPKISESNQKQPQKIQQKLQSNIKSLTSQFNDFIISSNEVFQRQQKPFDIIKGTMRNFKSQINLFPKLRLQRLDNDYHKRQAFIRGDIQKIRNIQNRSKSEIKFFSTKNYESSQRDDFKPQRILLRRREPVEFAFKITENPEIIRKKLVLQK